MSSRREFERWRVQRLVDLRPVSPAFLLAWLRLVVKEKVYGSIMQDVMEKIQATFEEEGIDRDVLTTMMDVSTCFLAKGTL
jgi:hypothetical protein